MSRKRRRRKKRKKLDVDDNYEGRKFVDSFVQATNDSLRMIKTGSAVSWLTKMKVEELEELQELLAVEKGGDWPPLAILLPELMCSWEIGLLGPPEEMTKDEAEFVQVAHFELSNMVRMLIWKRRGWIRWELPEVVFGNMDGDQQHFLVYPTEKGIEAGIEEKLKAAEELQQY